MERISLISNGLNLISHHFTDSLQTLGTRLTVDSFDLGLAWTKF